MSSEIRGKPAAEIKADDIIACTGCGSISWVPGIKVQEWFLGDESVLCPQCGSVLIKRDSS